MNSKKEGQFVKQNIWSYANSLGFGTTIINNGKNVRYKQGNLIAEHADSVIKDGSFDCLSRQKDGSCDKAADGICNPDWNNKDDFD